MPPAFYDVLVPLIEEEPHSAGWMLGLSRGRYSGPRIESGVTVSGSAWPRWPDPNVADVEVRLAFAEGTERVVVCKVVAEWSEQVHWSLPAIVGFAFEQHRLPVSALLVCRTNALARRYRQGVEVGPGNVMAVTAVGPGDFPDLVTGPGPWNAGMAVAAAALRRKPVNDMNDLFAATLDRRLAELEPERAAACAAGLLGLLASGPAQLLAGVIDSGTKAYHERFRAAADRLPVP
jgi:hypothetical protein